MLGEEPSDGAFYIKCSQCVFAVENNDEQAEWESDMVEEYRKQHESWLQDQDEEQQRLEKEQDAVQKAFRQKLEHVVAEVTEQQDDIGITQEDIGVSPPALTDTSLTATGESGVSTPRPRLAHRGRGQARKHAFPDTDESAGEVRLVKKARHDPGPWAQETDIVDLCDD
jgi:SWI/SNF-related matrix-associated actin-dependent regulator of chromatin subfamily A member 5